MRFLVGLVSVGAALALIAASGLMNWVFMTSLGKSEFEQQILGAVSVAVSAFLALLPTLILWAYREGRPAFILLGLPVFLAFAAFSLSSAIGFAAKNRGSITGGTASARRSRGQMIDGEAWKQLCGGMPGQAVNKQIAAAAPRRVPRLNQHGIQQ